MSERAQAGRLIGAARAIRATREWVYAQEAEARDALALLVGHLLGAGLSAIHVFRGDGMATVVERWSEARPTLAIETELALDGDAFVARVFDSEDSWRTPAVGG